MEITRLSAAQRCNADVLRAIVSYVRSQADLARAALTCKSWLQPSVAKLYTDIYLSKALSRESCSLTSVLLANQDLAKFVRSVTLDFDYLADNRHLSSRLALLASPGLIGVQKLYVHWVTTYDTRLGFFQQFSFSDAIEHLEICGIEGIGETNLQDLLSIFSNVKKFKMARGLELHFQAPSLMTVGSFPPPPSLTALSLNVTRYTSAIADLFIYASGTLEHFSLRVTRQHMTDISKLVNALQEHGARLRYLSLDFHHHRLPYLDQVVDGEYLPLLTSLRCSSTDSYTLALLDKLPTSIRTLDFQIGIMHETPYFPVYDIVALLEDRKRCPRHLSALVFRSNFSLDPDRRERIERVCREVNVDVTWETGRLESDPYF